MDAAFWHERWNRGQTAFDQSKPNRLLRSHWPDLDCRPDAPVLVPLCGKSVDMAWLADQGHPIIGSELSGRAVSGFFTDRDLIPSVRTDGPFLVHTAGPYELWCGDFFDLPTTVTASIGGVYDRASLVALPPDLRRRYAARLAELIPAGTPVLLVSFEYDQTQMDGPPFSVPGDEIASLFGPSFDLDRVASIDGLAPDDPFRQRGLTSLDVTVTVLRRRDDR